jgi:hypothetical protein
MLSQLNPKNLILLLGLSVLVLLTYGCAENNDTLPADQQEISETITTDEDGYYGMDLMSETDPGDMGGTVVMAKTNSPVDPRGYGRRVKIWRTGLTIEKSDDGQIAIATISYRMKGQFLIRLKNTTDTLFIKKPIDHSFQRKIRFIRNTDTNAIHYWKHDAITPAYGLSNGGTMSLTGNIVIKVHHFATGLDDQFTITDPLNTFIPFNALPSWAPQDVVTLEIAIANSNTTDAPYGIAHRGRHAQPLSRLKGVFNDDGLNGDVTANDGIYTYQWTVINNGIVGPHVGIFDFFTTSTIFDSVAPYNSMAVAFPFFRY